MPLDAAVVGAGPAGIGVATVLKGLGVRRLAVLEKSRPGASFERWPREMRFISPSFTSNFFGQLDLNAVAPATSPAFTLRAEHPSGAEYARYLRAVADFFRLPVRNGVTVRGLARENDVFVLDTSKGPVRARFVVWATGEFGFPRIPGFSGAGLCRHNASVRSWARVDGRRFVVIGGFESGIDAAVHLVDAGRTVTVFDRRITWDKPTSDPSCVLTPFTHERLRRALSTGRLTLIGPADVTAVARSRTGFNVTVTRKGGRRQVFHSDGAPILATGFEGGLSAIAGHFEWHKDGHALLGKDDESTRVPGLFVAGPQVRHDKLILCFIYKFRLRFGVVAKAIGSRLGLDTSRLEPLRKEGLFLDDLSCCGEECAC